MINDLVIVYPNVDTFDMNVSTTCTGAILFPSRALGIETVAKKDVPAGMPYIFVNVTEFPARVSDWSPWFIYDFANPDGYGLGPEGFETHIGARIIQTQALTTNESFYSSTATDLTPYPGELVLHYHAEYRTRGV
jgi:hypothetical protein